MIVHQTRAGYFQRCRPLARDVSRVESQAEHLTINFRSTTRAVARCMPKYYRISLCTCIAVKDPAGVALGLTPAQVHALQHLSPVHSLCSTGACLLTTNLSTEEAGSSQIISDQCHRVQSLLCCAINTKPGGTLIAF